MYVYVPPLLPLVVVWLLPATISQPHSTPFYDPAHPDAAPAPHSNAEWVARSKREQLRGAPTARAAPPAASCVGTVTQGRFSGQSCQQAFEAVQREDGALHATQWCEKMFNAGCTPPASGSSQQVLSLGKRLGEALQRNDNATVAALLAQAVELGEQSTAEVVYRWGLLLAAPHAWLCLMAASLQRLHELNCTQTLHRAMDTAHGRLFSNRMGRHSGLGPNDVEGYSSIAEQRSLRGFFAGGGFSGLVCETGFNGGHSAANYLVPSLFGQDIRCFEASQRPCSLTQQLHWQRPPPEKS